MVKLFQQADQMAQITAEAIEQIVQQIGAQLQTQSLGMREQHFFALVVVQQFLMKHMAPAMTRTQILAQR